MADKHTNRLVREKSPYLLQHAHNPVDWHPWGEDAFTRARAENKPIFLSIGYSTCHWCHVMERESFEDEKIAHLLNESYVSIKVDREERPDVDKIYMTFVQATTGSGGWPLNVFLTPELKPFFGGTYFPPDQRQGRPGFPQVLQQIAALWQERKNEIAGSAANIHARLEAATGDSPTHPVLTPAALKNAAETFKRAYDPRHGGFGGAPKFPQPAMPSLLLHGAQRFHDEEARRMVLHTCERMAAGGIHDQLGGGFARYSVDAEWLVPHFEKMLYDNAQLANLYLDAHLVSEQRVPQAPALPKETDYSTTVRDILDYVLRDMTHPEGGFYSAEDADSEGHEGKFYCWTYDELSKLLLSEEFNVAAHYFGITKEGNFVDHSHPHPLPGQNVLYVAADVRRRNPNKLTDPPPHVGGYDDTLLASAKQKMLAERNKRVRPHLDDKILASWNGLMLGALARASIVLDDKTYRAAAEKNIAFIQHKLWDAKTQTLYHRWRDGEHDQVQLLEAYAFLLSGVMDLYEATLISAYLDFAVALAGTMISKFYDPDKGGFWQSDVQAKDLILRVKDDYDGAEPSGNSVATLALLKLAAITGRSDFKKPAEATLRLFAHRLQHFPQAMPFMMHALDFSIEEPRRVVLAGNPGSAGIHELLRAAHSIYQPNKVVLGNTGAVEEFARTLPDGKSPVAYVCTGNSCLPPTQDTAKIREMLK